MRKPVLDKDFYPLIKALEAFEEKVNAVSPEKRAEIALVARETAAIITCIDTPPFGTEWTTNSTTALRNGS